MMRPRRLTDNCLTLPFMQCPALEVMRINFGFASAQVRDNQYGSLEKLMEHCRDKAGARKLFAMFVLHPIDEILRSFKYGNLQTVNLSLHFGVGLRLCRHGAPVFYY